MDRQMSRIARRRQREALWRPNLDRREAWWLLLLAGVGLLVGALVQDPVRYGYLVAAVAAMLVVRLAIQFDPPRQAGVTEKLPSARNGPLLWGILGVAVAAASPWLLPQAVLTGAWAVAGLVMLLMGGHRHHYPLRFAGAIALGLAAGHLIAVDSFPTAAADPPRLVLGSFVLGGKLLRQVNFAVAAVSGLIAVWAYRPDRGERPVRDWLTVIAHLTSLWVITYEIADAIPITRGAVSMGNEALLIATAWGLYGLALTLTAPLAPRGLPWLALGQVVSISALGFLLMGGLMAQARWADVPFRYGSYAGVVGSVWLSAWVQHRRGALTESDRLLALAVAALAYAICSFEVARWLEPLFTYPAGTVVTPAMVARDQRVQTGWSLAVWLVYALGTLGVASRFRSRPVRLMGTILLLSTLLFGLLWRFL